MYPIGSYAVPQILSVNPQLNIDSFVMPANDLAENVEGYFDICVTEDSESIGRIDIPVSEDISETEWRWCENKVDFPEGVHAVYLVYHGRIKVQLKDIRFR